MRFAFNSILLRLVVAQVLVITSAFFVMLLMVGQHRGAAAARTIAPIWAAAALRTLDASGAPTKKAMTISALLGMPPADADRGVLALRYRVLRQELLAQGLPVREVLVARAQGRETTWLEVQMPGRSLQWVGFEGGVFGPEEPTQRWSVIAVILLLVMTASALLTWMIVRPLTRLQRAIERFRAEGAWSDFQLSKSSTGGPQELRAIEQSFIRMARERSQLEHDRTLMLAGISHDLRSPLARIRLHADFLPDASASVYETKQAIKRNVDLADRHLAGFLDFAAPSSHNDWQLVDVQSLWEDAAALALPTPLSLLINVTPPSASIFTCPRLLVRVLATGLENAERHGRAPLVARARQHGEEWVFEVEDDGLGLSAAERERVMRPFERGERSRTTSGTGLGLALAQQIAQRLRGNVVLDQNARGLIFRCSVPALREGSL